MARPQKLGLDYFPHDTDAMSDEKIESMILLYGANGYMFYFGLLERIYRTPNQELLISASETIQILCRKLCTTPDEFKKMLETAFGLGCFNEELYKKHKILTSEGVKKRARPCLHKREKMRLVYEKGGFRKDNIVSEAETPVKDIVSEAGMCSKVKESKVKESKVKESKVKESKDINKGPDPLPENLNNQNFKDAWDSWITYRKEIKKTLTPSAEKQQLKFLSARSDDAIAIVERSIQNSWQGLFELEKGTQNGRNRISGQKQSGEANTKRFTDQESAYGEHVEL